MAPIACNPLLDGVFVISVPLFMRVYSKKRNIQVKNSIDVPEASEMGTPTIAFPICDPLIAPIVLWILVAKKTTIKTRHAIGAYLLSNK